MYMYIVSCADLERGGGGGRGVWTPLGKSQVAIGFLRNMGTDLLQKVIGPQVSPGGGV